MGTGHSVLVQALHDPNRLVLVKNAFADLDKDKSGALDKDEWKAFGRVVFKAHEKEKSKDGLASDESYATGDFIVERDRKHDHVHEPTQKEIDEFVKDAFSKVDVNKDGKVSFEEFQNYLYQVNLDLLAYGIIRALDNPSSALLIRSAFEALDTDQNNKLDPKEFELFGREVFKMDHKDNKDGHTPTQEEISAFTKSLWKSCDKNSDGFISWTEFLEWFERRRSKQSSRSKKTSRDNSSDHHGKDEKRLTAEVPTNPHYNY